MIINRILQGAVYYMSYFIFTTKNKSEIASSPAKRDPCEYDVLSICKMIPCEYDVLSIGANILRKDDAFFIGANILRKDDAFFIGATMCHKSRCEWNLRPALAGWRWNEAISLLVLLNNVNSEWKDSFQ